MNAPLGKSAGLCPGLSCIQPDVLTSQRLRDFNLVAAMILSGRMTAELEPETLYSDPKHPDHAAAVRDVNDAYRFNAYEMPDQEITEMATKLTGASTPAAPAAPAEPFREIAQIVSTPEGRIALQRKTTGQPLDARQAAIVARHDELLAANNAQARKEQASAGGWMKVRPPRSVGSDVQAWLNNPHIEQRRQLAREFIAKVQNDPAHDYRHPERGTLCDNAKLGMKIAYEVADKGECTSVQIGADGSISDQ